MTVMTVASTGHVLGAIFRRGGAEVTDAAALLPDGIVVRDPATGIVQFVVPARQLTPKSVALVGDCVLRPRAYAMKAGAENEVEPLLTQTAQPAAPLSANGVKVTAAAANQPAWALVMPAGGGDPLVASGKSAAAGDFTLPLAVPPGTYNVLILLQGSKPVAKLGQAA